jgi:hypothetical protein
MRINASTGRPVLPDTDPSIALVQAIRNEEMARTLLWQKRDIDAPSSAGGSIGKAAAGIRAFQCLLILCFLLAGTAGSLSQVACKPFLSIDPAREARAASPPTVPWTWNATIIADAGYCASRSGSFEVDFVRIKENSADLQFTHKFRWSESHFDVSIELMPDEAILEFRIGFIAPCVCRDLDQLPVAANIRAAERPGD